MFRGLILVVALGLAGTALSAGAGPDVRHPDGREFESWEKSPRFTKTYYVDNRNPKAADSNPGTREEPFLTINRAAQVLQPGERAVIMTGVYRERVSPARGGSGPDAMISYEAGEGANVVVKGSVIVNDRWKRSTGWSLRGQPTGARIWEIQLDGSLFGGYNPFGMVNVLHDRYWLNYKTINMAPYFRRRGMVFVDGKPLEQVDMYRELAGALERSLSAYSDARSEPLFQEIDGVGGKFWIEHNGMTLHVRLPNDDSPDQHVIEITTQEQVFAPADRYLGYIHVKGITFEHAGNGFPVPQRGLVSTNRGHHWIIEDNTIRWANAVALDVGNEDWNASRPEGPLGHHIIRNNVIRCAGICGIAGPATQDLLIEGNLVEWVGWQDAQRMWESSGIKLHGARNLVLRRNVIRHMRHASGIWLDVGNVNCRLTRNVFADITTVNAAIHIEGTHQQNQIDNNIVWDVRRGEATSTGGGSGIFIQGTDKLIIAHNLIGKCENSGVYTSTVPDRILLGRGGTARDNRVHNNIFATCGKAGIEFSNSHNEADGNLYAGMPGGFLRILTPEPQQWLDLEAWREFHGWDRDGRMAEAEMALDAEEMALTLLVKGEMPKVAIINGITEDFFGYETGPRRIPGPFADLDKGYKSRKVDPRQP